jgi:hypothetical protein
MLYAWRGEKAPNPDDPEEEVLVVYRPALGGPVLGPAADVIPLNEVAEFFSDS